ncbi:MAG: chemotaxis response regulator protein-glutamate methylesterase [Deltaproteobacteria bacterium]|jgi:two-component system chemotaxis response regulator CheB|nr:chemotaxis response regulator protein-glutamate methylesterase [Deltaproteobacteria bacterium]MBW2540524.1 chemotaxis response regulator protein-glutamate methylesterase [Deltaproteobacteria bacterium]
MIRSLIRVLVIDDSAFSRQAITRMLDASPLVEVVGVARDGEEALRKTFELQPDLITVDLEMPRMDGFTFLRVVMSKRPTPVIVVSGRTGEEDVFRALELGAVDFVCKPSPRATPELNNIEHELVRKVHAIRDLRIEKVQTRIGPAPARVQQGVAPSVSRSPSKVVVIGSSTGGPASLMQVFSSFVEAPPCSFVVAQHMPAGFTRGFAERLDRLTRMRAFEAEGGETLAPGTVLIAPGGKHLELENVKGRVVTRLVSAGDRDKYTPSVDRLFESAAKHIGSELLAVVLTGMGDDGREGVRSVHLSGGSVIAESESTAVIFGMPQQAIRTGLVDQILPLGEIAAAIQIGYRASPRREQDHEETS